MFDCTVVNLKKPLVEGWRGAGKPQKYTLSTKTVSSTVNITSLFVRFADAIEAVPRIENAVGLGHAAKTDRGLADTVGVDRGTDAVVRKTGEADRGTGETANDDLTVETGTADGESQLKSQLKLIILRIGVTVKKNGGQAAASRDGETGPGRVPDRQTARKTMIPDWDSILRIWTRLVSFILMSTNN